MTLFLTEQVAVPVEMVQVMRANQPMWDSAHRPGPHAPLRRGHLRSRLALPADRLATIAVPTLVIHGSDSPPWLAAAAAAVAEAIPGARHLTLTGQDHGVLQQPDARGPRSSTSSPGDRDHPVWRGWTRAADADRYERHYRSEVMGTLRQVPVPGRGCCGGPSVRTPSSCP